MINHNDTLAFLDHESCEYISDDQKELNRLLNYYDYDKRREHKHHSHYCGDLSREEEVDRIVF